MRCCQFYAATPSTTHETKVHLGSDFPHAIMTFLRSKFRNPVVLRKMLLEGHRWTPQELLAERMVDELVKGGSKAVLERALAVADKRSSDAKTGCYGLIKVLLALPLARTSKSSFISEGH
jgi:enoyl-CoA hydratase/carnithine racemase